MNYDTMNRIETLPPTLLDRAVLTLERAFSSDPMFEWIFPDPVQRSRSLRVLNRVPLSYGLRLGWVTHMDEGRAVAVWVPPGKPVTTRGMIVSGILEVPFKIGFGPFAKFAAASGSMSALHKKWVPEPHWYLLIVGVDTEIQGRGVGTQLVREGLGRADRERTPCYLETSSERNLPFYERLGFRVVGSAPLGTGGPDGWAMRREPRSGR